MTMLDTDKCQSKGQAINGISQSNNCGLCQSIAWYGFNLITSNINK